jgi:diguanylate cyclase (GGDEF)-like protein/PAS domain S-box-containing protein
MHLLHRLHQDNQHPTVTGSAAGLRTRFFCIVELAFVLVLALMFACALVFAGINSAQAKTLVDQKTTLVVGSEQDYPPFATGMTDATAGGFTVDLWKALAHDSALNYTLTVRPFHQLLQDFKDGKIDVLINLAQSDERRTYADFSVPHVIVNGAIFVRKDGRSQARIRSESDLAKKSIIVIKGDLANEYALAQGWGKQLVLVNTAAEGMRLLASGHEDALLLNRIVGLQAIEERQLVNIELLDIKPNYTQRLSFAVHKGRPELLYTLNEGLALARSNGNYDALHDKWFGIYEEKKIGLRQLLLYLLPLIAGLLTITGYHFYRRQQERQQAQAAIAESHDLLMTIIDSIPVRVFWKDRHLLYLGCNSAFATDTGHAHPDQVIGKNVHELDWSRQAELYRDNDLAVIASGEARLFYEILRVTPSGETRWLRASKIPLRNKNQETIGVLGVYEDITARKQSDDKLRQLSIAVEQSPASVLITNLDGIIEYVNPRFVEVTGYSAAEALGKNPRFLRSDLTPVETNIALWRQINSGLSWRGEFINKRKNGDICWEESHIAPVKNEQGATTHYVAVQTDITARKQLEEQVRHMAFHDELTKLPNRRMLGDRLSLAMAASKRSKRYGALLFLDLDHFKLLNDRHGHDAGDTLLRQVAQRLKACVREIDTVARMGGDEFIVLLGDLSEYEQRATELAEQVTEKIRAALSAPYSLTVRRNLQTDQQANQDITHRCTTSIGLALFLDQECDQESILNRADTAMYLAKKSGGNMAKLSGKDPSMAA